MRRLLLVLINVAVFAAADSVTVESNFSFGVPVVDYVGGFYTDNFFVVFPQFNPSLGTLQSIDYSFTDFETLLWGFNDVDEPAGIPFQVIFSGELKGGPNSCCASNGLPIDIKYTSTIDDVTTGRDRDISNGGSISFDPPFSSSGTSYSGFGDFIGTSDAGVGFLATASIMGPPIYPVFVQFNGAGGSDFGVLDLTYNYIPTPEPRWIAPLTMLVALAAGFRRKKS